MPCPHTPNQKAVMDITAQLRAGAACVHFPLELQRTSLWPRWGLEILLPFLAIFTLERWGLTWALTIAIAAAVPSVLLTRRLHRRQLANAPIRRPNARHPGWRVEFHPARLYPIGQPKMAIIQGLDAAWSLGCYPVGMDFRIELRHQDRGPVALLCTVLQDAADPQAAAALPPLTDALVDQLAARLGVRRSGGRLTPAANAQPRRSAQPPSPTITYTTAPCLRHLNRLTSRPGL
ncbi:hypothetical protein ABFV80_002715 [Vandammella animalimorsus]|uniref:hypothetical protein n=1 Tax=Vandammella animalimorsus TaxID=2029117 RepID=UPI00325A6856